MAVGTLNKSSRVVYEHPACWVCQSHNSVAGGGSGIRPIAVCPEVGKDGQLIVLHRILNSSCQGSLAVSIVFAVKWLVISPTRGGGHKSQRDVRHITARLCLWAENCDRDGKAGKAHLPMADGGIMSEDKRDVLEVLRYELNFLEQGGYGNWYSTPWGPASVFQDSLTCPNH